MTTGIGNEMDPGDPPEIHAERKREKRVRKKCNNLAAVLPMYEAFKKLEGILDEALRLLRDGVEASDWNRYEWKPRAQAFIELHEKRISTSGSIAVGQMPEVK